MPNTMGRWIQRRRLAARRGERGQSIVEFALVMPVVLMVLFAIIDFGRAYSCWVTITNAAREGARLGITGADSSSVIARTQNTSAPYNDSNLAVAVSYQDSSGNATASGASGGSIVVGTTYSLSFISPWASLAHLLTGGSVNTKFTLTSAATMRIE